jgi:rhodanese-related sulfurtransferase
MSLTPEQLSQAVAEVTSGAAVLMDVRNDSEWEDGHAEGAVHWPLPRLQAGDMPDIPSDAKVYVHCAAGRRAEEARTILTEHGWTDVTNLGGLQDWQNAGGAIG